MGCLGIIMTLSAVTLVGIILFLIYPLLGIAWALWFVGVAVYTIRKNFRNK